MDSLLQKTPGFLLLFNSLDRRPGRDKISYICDFSRYEKSSSMKRPTLKVIDFDSVVQNTKVSKSIIFIPGFFNVLLHSRRSETTNMAYWFRCLLCYGQENEWNQWEDGLRIATFDICALFLGVCFEYFSKKDAKYPLIEKSVSIRVLTLWRKLVIINAS